MGLNPGIPPCFSSFASFSKQEARIKGKPDIPENGFSVEIPNNPEGRVQRGDPIGPDIGYRGWKKKTKIISLAFAITATGLKILASRLSSVISNLVDDSQSGFIKGRCIADNIIGAQEVIFNLQKRKSLGYVFKVDFAKAFDSLDWNFLLDVLAARGFRPRWLSWIHTILCSAKTQFIINGTTQVYIRCRRGLRQGDPLSSLLFALVVDVLSAMFFHALRSKVLFGVPLNQFDSICHLQYADDLLIFSAGGQDDLRIIKLILYVFEGSSGLSINFSKSWVPLSGKRPKRLDWDKLIGAVRSRLTPWKANYLSLGGRLTLINSVLSTVPVYWMSVFKLPAWVIKDIDQFRRDFLWKGPDLGSKGIRLVAWNRITRPKDMGGWGILNLSDFNIALLGKWSWKLSCNPNCGWAKIIYINYLNRSPTGVLSYTPPRNKSFFWAGVIPALLPFRSCIKLNQDDSPNWVLEKNGKFTVKSFYKFLIDSGLYSPLYSHFWKTRSPSKITLFCWLAGEDKILTLTNLFKRRCNFQNTSDICVLCHNASEDLDHLFLNCTFSNRIWHFFFNSLTQSSLHNLSPRSGLPGYHPLIFNSDASGISSPERSYGISGLNGIPVFFST
ncbi:uncharacterized protein LOC120276209 [Dioscorea cayenensis subsp. rotundata]|uniref:Uncharacterized protein LOC120276209 n=1 Tax=Dioscorea cayennensis subsp. rotundata TaxID=55577 RepID=A0AB40CJR7_DIOCR|nr:uncharacterized protein LOC120276209 [Dioscorea cayenensis subsp. rotundata]